MDKLFNLLQGHNVDEAIGKVTVKEDEHEFVVRQYRRMYFGLCNCGSHR